MSLIIPIAIPSGILLIHLLANCHFQNLLNNKIKSVRSRYNGGEPPLLCIGLTSVTTLSKLLYRSWQPGQAPNYRLPGIYRKTPETWRSSKVFREIRE